MQDLIQHYVNVGEVNLCLVRNTVHGWLFQFLSPLLLSGVLGECEVRDILAMFLFGTSKKTEHKRNQTDRTKYEKKSFSFFSVIEKTFGGVTAVCAILCHGSALPAWEEVGTEQSVEVNQYHDVHEDHGGQEVARLIQPAEVVQDVPGDVELGAKAEAHVGEDVENLVGFEERRVLGPRQLEHQTCVQGDTVHLHQQGDDGTCHIVPREQSVQEAPKHQEMMKQEFP